MGVASGNKRAVQKAIDALVQWANVNELHVNEQKMELVVFRKGGRLTQTDKIYCRGFPLKNNNLYKHLGITVQTTGKMFSIHIQERLYTAVRSISDIDKLQRISLKTAMRLFEAKIVPTLTYCIKIIW